MFLRRPSIFHVRALNVVVAKIVFGIGLVEELEELSAITGGASTNLVELSELVSLKIGILEGSQRSSILLKSWSHLELSPGEVEH